MASAEGMDVPDCVSDVEDDVVVDFVDDEAEITHGQFDSARLRESEPPLSARGLVPINEQRINQGIVTAADLNEANSMCFNCQALLQAEERIDGDGTTFCTKCYAEMKETSAYVGNQEDAPILEEVLLPPSEESPSPHVEPDDSNIEGADIAEDGGGNSAGDLESEVGGAEPDVKHPRTVLSPNDLQVRGVRTVNSKVTLYEAKIKALLERRQDANAVAFAMAAAPAVSKLRAVPEVNTNG